MLVVTQKHMQNADWVYYPFKSSHVFDMKHRLFKQLQTVLVQVHDLYNRKRKKKQSTVKMSTTINK